MFNFIKRLFSKSTPKKFPRSEKRGDKLEEWEADSIANLFCPDCGDYESLLGGPQGGASQNMLCRNCFSEFNITIWNPRHFDRKAKDKDICIGERISDKGQGRKSLYGV